MIGSRSTTVTAFIIASLGANSKAPDLLLHDIGIYNRALSAVEVKALYDHERTPPDITVSKPKPPTESDEGIIQAFSFARDTIRRYLSLP